MTSGTQEKDAQPPDLTVFFDGSCPLCRAEMGVYKNCHGAEKIAFVDVATLASGQVAPGLDQAGAMAAFHVMESDGSLASGVAGFARLWLALPGWRWLGRVVMLPFVLPAAELAYRMFLPIRPSLQRLWRWRYSDHPRGP
jgi:predicted DCC family thiol-disulfide oxidoreductase YuxK